MDQEQICKIRELKLKTMRPPIFVDELIINAECDLYFPLYGNTISGQGRELLKRQLSQWKYEVLVDQLPNVWPNELAKQLKDAGFPYEENRFGGDALSLGRGVVRIEDSELLIPTLPELIEACGDLSAFNLQHYKNGEWSAFADLLDDRQGAHASTPEEAVARLWLALTIRKSK